MAAQKFAGNAKGRLRGSNSTEKRALPGMTSGKENEEPLTA
jgi:hypothetical protein